MDSSLSTLRRSLCELIARREAAIRLYESILTLYPWAQLSDADAALFSERALLAYDYAELAALDVRSRDTHARMMH